MTALVDAAPVRAHLDDLRAAGVGLVDISRMAGVPFQTLWGVTARRYARCRPETAAVLDVPVPESWCCGICDEAAWLAADGCDPGVMADRLGRTPAALARRLRRHGHADLARPVEALVMRERKSARRAS